MGEAMGDKKTIAFYIGDLSRGGAEKVMINLARYFMSLGYEVYLVTKTVGETEYEVPEGINRLLADITPEEETKSRIKNLIKRITKLRGIWKEIKPDLILSFIRKNNLMAIASSDGLGIPVVVGIRSNPERELQGRGFKQLSFLMFKKAAGIVVQTSGGKSFLPGGLQKKTVILPNSISPEYIGSEPVQFSERRKEIVLVGRIDSNKNQRMVLEAFSEIMDEYRDWSLHLYGDGELAAGLRNRFDCDGIVFHGQVSDVKSRIEKASVFVLPSKQEGMPNALIEAMALGLACISTDCPCGGPADLIKQDENGILIPVDDREKLKEQLCRLMDDEQLRIGLGKEASKIAEDMKPEKVNQLWKEYLEGFIR